MVSATGDFVYTKFSEINVIIRPSCYFTVKYNNSVSFLSCLLVFFFLHQGPNSFFSVRANHCVFELSVPCVCLFDCVIVTEFDYRIRYNRFEVVLHAVDSLNVKHELR